MKKATIVIGAMFGDEGKGNVTDVLCTKHASTINVRFNGGAQAAHTVVTPEGKRHVFRHFGAGTLMEIPTYLSEDFLVNPFAFDEEWRRLEKEAQITPQVYVNPNSRVTTLWDIYINQAVETIRGDKRHGSCGMGIDETVQRSKQEEYQITVRDLMNVETLRKKLENIQNKYVPMRLKNHYQILVEELPTEYKDLFENAENIDMTVFYAEEFLKHVQIMGDYLLKRYDNVVFEGAQGLMLDQNFKRFSPNLTTSNTGIKNVMKMLQKMCYRGELEIDYVSRCYATRHGRGEFPTEVKKKPYANITDLTNVPNEFQESLRFGILDMDLLIEGINLDLQNLCLLANINIVFTCFDQLDSKVLYKVGGEEKSISKEQFLDKMRTILKQNINSLSGMYVTQGEKRADLIEIKENPRL